MYIIWCTHICIYIFFGNARQDAAIEGMKGLRDRFKNGPEQGKIMACHVEMLLQEKCLQQAKDLVEECIKGKRNCLSLSNQLLISHALDYSRQVNISVLMCL